MFSPRKQHPGLIEMPTPSCRAGEGNVNGFGLEFYIETPADEVSETIHDIKQSWQFQLLYTVSQLAAGEAQSGWCFCCCMRACNGP